MATMHLIDLALQFGPQAPHCVVSYSLEQRRHADRCRSGSALVRLVGVEFSSTDRNIQRLETEQA